MPACNCAIEILCLRCLRVAARRVMHEGDVLDKYGSVQAYVHAEGPHAYWYNQTRESATLRLEDAPRPGGGGPPPQRIAPGSATLVDCFSGAGGFSMGAQWAGWKVIALQICLHRSG